MKYPKLIKRYCPHCRIHTEQKVSIYKKGKDNVLHAGNRRHKKRQRGYGSFPKEIFHKNAKLNKRTVPLLECSKCGKIYHAKSYRVKRFELQEK